MPKKKQTLAQQIKKKLDKNECPICDSPLKVFAPTGVQCTKTKCWINTFTTKNSFFVRPQPIIKKTILTKKPYLQRGLVS